MKGYMDVSVDMWVGFQEPRMSKHCYVLGQESGHHSFHSCTFFLPANSNSSRLARSSRKGWSGSSARLGNDASQGVLFTCFKVLLVRGVNAFMCSSAIRIIPTYYWTFGKC